MKIAVFHNLPSGGGKRFLDEVVSGLREKHNVSIFHPKKERFKNYIHYLFYAYYSSPRIHKEIAKSIDSKNFDLVFVNPDYITKAPYLLKFLKTRSFYLCHEEPREFYNDRKYLTSTLKLKIVNFFRKPLQLIDKQNTSYADYLIANSNFSKTKLEKIYNKEFIRIPMGVNTNIFSPKECREQKDYYLTVGCTAFFKGIDFIVRSISLLPEKHKYPLVVVGHEGSEHEQITQLAKNLGVKLIIYNNIDDNKLSHLYSGAKLLLAAGTNEPFGLSLIEAISCGTQVVAVNEGGYTEIITNEMFGELVDRNENKFSNAIIRRLSIKGDKIFLHNQVKRSWRWTNTVKQLEKVFINS